MREDSIYLKDNPYSILKKDARAYEIMLLRDQYENTFTAISIEYGLSIARVIQIYNKQKAKQKHLYIHHISAVLGYQSTAQIKKVFDDAYECYQKLSYACAYMEKTYQDILTVYRAGEPGSSPRLLESLPPFEPTLSKQTIARVIEMRDIQKASFITIAKELCMTQAKAKRTYESFYHQQVVAIIKALQEKAESHEEKEAIWDYYFRGYKSSKKRYDTLINDPLLVTHDARRNLEP